MSDVAPVLVLGLGNLLLTDDGVGLALLERLAAEPLDGVEYLDGGTQGLALCGRLVGRRALILLDCLAFGAAPGTVHVLDDPLRHAPPRSGSAHEANAGELLRAALLLGDLPERVVLVGVEPDQLRTRIGLSEPVEQALPTAEAAARRVLESLTVTLPVTEPDPCASPSR